jgi:Na+-transporting NADH:ubiquinone oxidoreductase subunit E
MNEAWLAFSIFFAAIFTNNILLTNYLGMCSFLAISREVKTSIGLGFAVILVMAVTSALNWLVYAYLLVPLGLVYLRYIAFILVIAAFVQLTEMVIERVSDVLYAALGIFLPLITVNCAILGASLFMVIREYSFASAFAYGLGSGIGWTLAIIAMAGIRGKMARARIPRGLEGAGITLIITGFMAIAFMGLAGVIRI